MLMEYRWPERKVKKRLYFGFVSQSDMVWLSETKQCFNVSVPGFKVFYNCSKHGAHRGGIMLLVKDKLLEFVQCVNMESEGQIWVTLNFLITYKLGGVYIPPDDSPYFEQVDLGILASNTVESGNLVVLGDLNGRVAVPNINDSNNAPYVYSGVVDLTVNARGKSLVNMCANNKLVIANHLKCNSRQLGGNLSYRKGSQWISKFDL